MLGRTPTPPSFYRLSHRHAEENNSTADITANVIIYNPIGPALIHEEETLGG